MEEIRNIIEIVEEHYAKGQNSPEIMNFLNNFPTNINNLAICQQIIEKPEINNHAKLFASDAFNHIVQNFVKQMNFHLNAKPIVTWVLNFLFNNCGNTISTVTVDLSAAVAHVFVHFFSELPNEITTIHSNISQFLQGDIVHCNEGMTIYSSILDEICRTAPDKIIRRFQKEYMYDIFNSVRAVIDRVKDTPIQTEQSDMSNDPSRILIKKSIIVLEKTLSFQPAEKAPNAGNLKHASNQGRPINNTNLIEEINNPLLADYIYQLYQNFRFPETLDVIIALLGLMSLKGEVINNICGGLANIIHFQIGTEDESVRFRLSIIAAMIPSKLNAELIFLMPTFSQLIESLFSFSISFFQDINLFVNQSNTVEYLISFWEKIENQLRDSHLIEIRNFVGVKVFEICGAYIEAMLTISSSEEGEAQQGELFRDNISTLISPFRYLVIFNPPQIFQYIMTQFQQKKDQLFQIINSQSNFQDAIIIQKHLAVYVQIIISMLMSISYDKNDSYRDTINVESFSSVLKLMQETSPLVSNGVLFPELENSMLLLIVNLNNTIFASTCAHQSLANFSYQRLAQICGISSKLECHNFFFNRVLVTLRAFTECENILNMAIYVLCNFISPSAEALHQLIASPFETNLPFLSKSAKLRRFFFKALINLVFKSDNSMSATFPCSAEEKRVLLNGLLQIFDVKFNNLSDQAAFEFLAVDICGIFCFKISNVKNDDSYGTLFNWFFPDRMAAFSQAFIGSCQDLRLFNLVLKMCTAIVPSTALQANVFQCSSPNGVILFKFLSGIICAYLALFFKIYTNGENIDEFLKNSALKGLKYCMVILNNTYTGKFVLFDAFKIYSDPVLMNLLCGISQVLKVINIDDIFHYPNIFHSIILFLNNLSVRHIKDINQNEQPEQLKELNEFIIDFATKGLFSMNRDTTLYSVKTIKAVVKYMFKEKNPVLCSQAQIMEKITKAVVLVWQLMFNKEEDSTSLKDMTILIKKFLLMNPTSYQFVKGKILEITPDANKDEVGRTLALFESSLPEVLNYDAINPFIEILKELKLIVNKFIVYVSFV